MIKLKKIVATVVAAAMCLGMGVTSFAAVSSTGDFYWNSPNYRFSVDRVGTGNGFWYIDNVTGQYTQNEFTNGVRNNFAVDPNGNLIGGVWFNDVTDQYGASIDWQPKALPTKTLESINSEEKVRGLLEDAGYEVNKDWDLVPVVAFTVDLDKSIDANGAYAWFDAEELGVNPAGYSAGQSVYVLRETFAGSGEWEVVEAELTEADGRLQARVQLTNRSQSLVVVRVMDDGRTIRLINKKNNTSVVIPNKDAAGTTATSTSSSATASPQASPKTGEF